MTINKITSFNEYISLATRTESANTHPTDVNVLLLTLGIHTLTTEILDGFKKQIFYGKEEKLQTKTVPALAGISQMVMTMVELLHGIRQEDGTYLATEETGLHLADELSDRNIRLIHGILGIITESGELGEILIKHIDDGKVDVTNLQEELNDHDWYSAILHDEFKLDFYQGLTNNINKLTIRYPEKFDAELAANRNLDAEREALEVGISDDVYQQDK